MAEDTVQRTTTPETGFSPAPLPPENVPPPSFDEEESDYDNAVSPEQLQLRKLMESYRNLDVEEEAHDEVQKQMEEVNQEQDSEKKTVKRQSLLGKIIGKIRSKLQEAADARRELNTTGRLTDERPQAKDIRKWLIELFDLAKNDYLTDYNISNSSKAVLLNLSQGTSLSDKTAPYIHIFAYNLLQTPDYIRFSETGSGQPTQLENNFEEIKNSPDAARAVSEAILKAKDEGNLKDIDLSMDELREKLQVPELSGYEKSQIAALDQNQQNEKRRRGLLVPDKVLTSEQKDRLERWNSLIKQLPYEKNQDVNAYLYRGKSMAQYIFQNVDASKEPERALLRDPDLYEAEVRKILKSIGIEGDDVDHWLEYNKIDAQKPMEENDVENQAEIEKILLETFSDPEWLVRTLFDGYEEKHLVWSDGGAGELVVARQMQKMLGLLYEKLDKNPGAEFQQLFNDLIEGRMVRRIITQISRLAKKPEVLALMRERSGSEEHYKHLYEQYKNFFENNLVTKAYIENNHRQLYHVFDDIVKTGESPENWSKILARYNISEFSVFTDDDIVQLVMGEWKNHTQQRIVANGNVMPSNFMVGEVGGRADGKSPPRTKTYEYIDLTTFRKDLEAFKSLPKFKDISPEDWEWQVNRAIAIARGILVIDGELTGIMSNTRPPQNFEDLPYAKILGLRNPLLNWVFGRGGRQYIREPHLLAMTIPRNELIGHIDQRLGEMRRNRWIPEVEIKKGKDYQRYLESIKDDEKFYKEVYRMLDDLFIDRDDTWANLSRELALPGWVDRGGWRFKGVKEIYKKSKDEGGRGRSWGGENWDDIYDWFDTEAGVAMGFISNEDRGDEESKVFLINALLRSERPEDDKYKRKILSGILPNFDAKKGDVRAGMNQLNAVLAGNDEKARSWKKALASEDGLRSLLGDIYRDVTSAHDRGEGTYNTRLKVKVDGNDVEVTYREYTELRRAALYGQSFYHLLLKDPNAFLNNLNQLLPEFATGHKTLANGETVKASEFYLGNQVLTKDEKEEKDRFLKYIGTRFGYYDGSAGNLTPNPENSEIIRKILDFYSDLDEDVSGFHGEGKAESGKYKEKSRQALYIALTTAHQKAKLNGNAAITAQDICSDEEFEVDENTITNEEARINLKMKKNIRIKMMEGDDSFIPFMKKFVENENSSEDSYFGSGKARFDENIPEDQRFDALYNLDYLSNLGRKHGFFVRIGDTWLYKDNVNSLPNGDISHKMLFHRASASGENGLTRSTDDYQIADKVIEGSVRLYSKLRQMSTDDAGDPKVMIEYQDEVLKKMGDVISTDYMRKKQYDITYLTCRFMQEHWSARIPILGRLFQSALRNDASLSKGYGERAATTWNSDQIRDHIYKLQIKGCLYPTGPYSAEALRKALGVDNAKFYGMEVAPNVGIALTIFLIYEYIRKSMEEEEKK